jgi:rod shape-determining protein MreC
MRPIIKSLFLTIISFGLLFFITDRFIFFQKGFLEQTAAKITYPFMQVSGAIASTIHNITKTKESYASLKEKYEKTLYDYYELMAETIKLRSEQHIYENIKEIADFETRYNFANKLLAKIVIKNLSENEHSFIISKGAQQGVVKDMVALYQNHIVGRVSDVYDTYSKVLLITDQHCKVAAYSSKTHSAGIVQGFNCINRCNLTYVSHLSAIQDNDLVISSGQGMVFPEGFCLGKVVLHTIKEKELYHYIEIEPIINFESLQYCVLATYAMNEAQEHQASALKQN